MRESPFEALGAARVRYLERDSRNDLALLQTMSTEVVWEKKEVDTQHGPYRHGGSGNGQVERIETGRFKPLNVTIPGMANTS